MEEAGKPAHGLQGLGAGRRQGQYAAVVNKVEIVLANVELELLNVQRAVAYAGYEGVLEDGGAKVLGFLLCPLAEGH